MRVAAEHAAARHSTGRERAHRRYATGRKLGYECPRSLRLQRIGSRHAVKYAAQGRNRFTALRTAT